MSWSLTGNKALWISGSLFALAMLYAGSQSGPRPFRVYRSLEAYDDVELPADYA